VAEIATFFHISPATRGAIAATLKRNARNRSALPMPNNTAIVDSTAIINYITHWHKNIAQKGQFVYDLHVNSYRVKSNIVYSKLSADKVTMNTLNVSIINTTL